MKQFCFILLSVISLSALGQLSGTYTVGSSSSDDFSCLTCSTGVFKTIADSGVSGNLIFEISSDLQNETGDYALKGWNSPNSILIKPANASTKTISYNNSSAGILIDLDSVSHLTIDGSIGGMGRYLRFESGQTNREVIQINNDCKHVVIKNCEIESDNTSDFSVFAGAINLRSFGTSGNDFITIDNNLIQPHSGSLRYGIYVSPPLAVGQSTDSLKITNNEFNNVVFRGIELAAGTGKIVSAQIMGNSFYASNTFTGSADAEVMSFVYLNNGEGHRVIGNFFGGKMPMAGGAKMNLDMHAFSSKMYVFRIGSGVGGSTPIRLEKNTIANFDYLGSSSVPMEFFGFKVNAACKAPVSIGNPLDTNSGNTVGDITAQGGSQSAASIYVKERRNSSNNLFSAIRVEGSGEQTIVHNKIGGIMLDNNNSNGIVADIIYANGGSYTIEYNTVGGKLRNIFKQCSGSISLINTRGISRIRNNRISGVEASGSFASNFEVITVFPSSQNAVISGNQIGGTATIVAKNASTTSSSFMGINVWGSSAKDLEVANNSFSSISLEGNTMGNVIHFVGVNAPSASSGIFRIDSNRISLTQETNGKVQGVYVFSPNNEVFIRHNEVTAYCRNFYENDFTGIDVKGKTTHNNRVYIEGNVLGDTGVVSSQYPAIELGGGATGKSNTSFGIHVVEANDYVRVKNNLIGGVQTKSSGREIPFIPILVGNVRDSLRVENNIIGNTSGQENLTFDNHSEFEYMMYLDLPDGLQKAIVQGNVFSGIKFKANSSNTRIYGIRATRGTAIGQLTLNKNKLMHIDVEGTGEKQFTGVFTNNNNTIVVNNEVSNIRVKSSKDGDQFWGIYVSENNSAHQINGNIVSNITLTQNQNGNNNAAGIFMFGPSSTFGVNGNKIFDFDLGISGGNAVFQGIVVNSCIKTTLSNNIILHSKGSKHSSQQDYGIYDFANSGSIEVYHNTINLQLDMMATSAGRSACYFQNNKASRRISNNLFANRTQGGRDPHYALYFADPTASIGSDFNLLHSTQNPDSLVKFGADYNLKGWQEKGFGLKSIAPPAQNLVNLTTGEQLTSLGNDIGLTNTGITADYRGNTRPQDGGPDLGAFEIPTANLPSGLTSIREAFSDYSSSLNVYPNPSRGVVYINSLQNLANPSIKVFAMSGEILLEQNVYSPNQQLDLSDFAAGIYWVVVFDNDKEIGKERLVIQ